MITSADEQFSSLLVWQDVNGDGESQSEEISTLGDWGIVSISLEVEAQNIPDNGNFVASVSSVEFSDGTTTGIADVHFGVGVASFGTNGETDIFDFRAITENESISMFEDGLDQIYLSGNGFDDLEFNEVRSGVIVSTQSGYDIFVANVAITDLTAGDFLFG